MISAIKVKSLLKCFYKSTPTIDWVFKIFSLVSGVVFSRTLIYNKFMNDLISIYNIRAYFFSLFQFFLENIIQLF